MKYGFVHGNCGEKMSAAAYLAHKKLSERRDLHGGTLHVHTAGEYGSVIAFDNKSWHSQAMQARLATIKEG